MAKEGNVHATLVGPVDQHKEKEETDRVQLPDGRTSMKLDDSLLTEEAEYLMMKMLPAHIVNCFLMTGYDIVYMLFFYQRLAMNY